MRMEYKTVITKTFATNDRAQWRSFLMENFKTLPEVWFVFPLKDAGEESISYNDAVEEALCVGWIDGVTQPTDEKHIARRFTPRKKGSAYSQPNIERLVWLDERGLIHPEIRPSVEKTIKKKFVFPKDILASIRKNKDAWAHYQEFTEPYKRIRVAYIDAARKRPEEFEKRLKSFIKATEKGKIIQGYGGVEKYYVREAKQ